MSIQRKGLFVALEGADFAGKTTQRFYVAQVFEAAGFKVITTREPGGTPLAEEIRETLLKPRDETFHPLAETLMFFAARHQHMQEVILPNLQAGNIVMTDRFVDSTYAYQSAGGGVDEETIDRLTDMVVGDNHPDMTFMLTLPRDVAKLRAASRGALDRIEGQPEEYYIKAQEAYLRRAQKYPERYTIIDASVSIEQVQAQILPVLMKLVNDLRPRATVN